MVTNKIYRIPQVSLWYDFTAQKNLFLRDSTVDVEKPSKTFELEKYFNDIYHLLQRDLVKLVYETEISRKDELRIKHLTSEVIKVKKMLTSFPREK